ncbi:hypothetical protein ACNOYE_30255 [Nannocystaceae bacterium ST9]
MSDVARAVKPLFDKFIDFFDIFDLSFVVSGATFVAALAWDSRTRALKIPDLVDGPLGIVALILAAYISGMTCFAIGRQVRKWVAPIFERRPPIDELFSQLVNHGVIEQVEAPNDAPKRFRASEPVQIPWLARYLAPGSRPSALYVRMWAEVRQQERLAASFSLLRRYWVSAATLDGLFVALATWGMFLLPFGEVAKIGPVPSLLAFGGSVFCMWEAQRYARYQLEELVGTVVHAYDPTGAAASHGSTSTTPPNLQIHGHAHPQAEPSED